MPYDVDMPEEMLLLARTLLERTKQGKIEWSVTDNDSEFLYSSTRSALLIGGDPYEGTYELQLLNHQGSAVATLSNEAEEEDSEIHRILEELFREARNRALEIDSTLTDIHKALGILDLSKD